VYRVNKKEKKVEEFVLKGNRQVRKMHALYDRSRGENFGHPPSFLCGKAELPGSIHS
jgi:hypothetical protein